MVFIQWQRMEDLLLRARVVVRTSKLYILRRRLVDHAEKLHRNAKKALTT